MIEFREVGKRYPDGTTAVESFSLRVESHETVVFLGSSGSGKTTLLRMVNRMVEPSSGSVLIDELDVQSVDKVRLRRSIGYVLQGVGLLPHRTIVDNVATVPMLNGVSRARARAEALELLDRVGLDRALAMRWPSQLSGGQQQRVGVARALASDPNILLMDEPFGAVDPIVRAELQAELRRLQQELGKTTIFVTHDVDEAFSIGDRVVILSTGGLVEQVDTPERIMAHPANEFVEEFIGARGASRTLRVQTVDGRDVVVDGTGRPVGMLAP